MALAMRLDARGSRVYVLLGDGELDEGSVWEAAMAAAHHRVHSLTAILDRNLLQVSGPTEASMRLEPVAAKWQAFGWEVFAVDGHDPAGILEALRGANEVRDKPSMIIARTVKGKGLPALEREGISVELISVPTLKPLDRERILGSVRKTGAVVTVEEHSVIGGLGSAVAELLAAHHPVPMAFVGVNDLFGESGSEQELYARHGLTARGIGEKVRAVLDRRGGGRGRG
jgi:transketolase